MNKFIFVTGGVVSSLGKGLASAAIGNLLESRRLKITFLKLDPYINVDPGTMNPYQHGEVYVSDIMNGSPPSHSLERAITRPVGSITPSSRKSGEEIISVEQSRSCPM
jgi:hypothetical protein